VMLSGEVETLPPAAYGRMSRASERSV